MKRGITWILLSCLMVISLVLASCTTKTTSSTSTSTTTKTTATTTIPTKTTAPPTTTGTTTTTATGNWWDSLGTPQYGGQMTLRINKDVAGFDPYYSAAQFSIMSAWMEPLHGNDWTLDPAVYAYQTNFRPSEYVTGNLAEGWELTDPNTYVIHLRQGIHWQDIPPANGREFTADDVVYHYYRLYGLGGGFTTASPYVTNAAAFKDLISMTATDKYTVVFKWKTPNPENITENMQALNSFGLIENSDAVKLWGNITDWHHAIGTGPFILQDFVSGSSATLIKNPNYWGYDERHLKNQLPYIDTLKFLIISDNATALSAIRTGKLDALDGIPFQDARSMQKTNPEILQATTPATYGTTIDPRNDVVPFNDLRVRKAMQMAIDLPTIASTYYGGTCSPDPVTLTTNYMTGYGFPYEQWPQDLKDQYAYNPTAAKKLLADAGYPNGFKTNIVVDIAADLDLLQIVKSYFAAIGIDMDIRTMDSASATAFIYVGHKHDQLAMRSVGSLGLGTELLRELTYSRTGAAQNFSMISDPVFDAFYPKALAATSLDEIKQILRDANEYVAEHHFAISLLDPSTFDLYQPWFKGYTGQIECLSAGSSGPIQIYFFMSRFWIDQNLKKSMGH